MRNSCHRWLGLCALLLALPVAWSQPTSTIPSRHIGAGDGGFFILPDSGWVRVNYAVPYTMRAFAERGIALHVPLPHRTQLAAAYRHSGNDAYHTQHLAAIYALQVAEHVHVGVGLDYSLEGSSDAHYDAYRQLTPSVVALWHARSTAVQMELAVHALHPNSPLLLRMAARHNASPRTTLVASVDNYQRWRAHLGMEYRTRWGFDLWGGLSTAPPTLHFGLGFTHRRWRIDVGADLHSALGLSPRTALSLCF